MLWMKRPAAHRESAMQRPAALPQHRTQEYEEVSARVPQIQSRRVYLLCLSFPAELTLVALHEGLGSHAGPNLRKLGSTVESSAGTRRHPVIYGV